MIALPITWFKPQIDNMEMIVMNTRVFGVTRTRSFRQCYLNNSMHSICTFHTCECWNCSGLTQDSIQRHLCLLSLVPIFHHYQILMCSRSMFHFLKFLKLATWILPCLLYIFMTYNIQNFSRVELISNCFTPITCLSVPATCGLT